MIIKANYTTKQWNGIQVNRGQFITGRKKLASDLNMTEQSVRTCINRLKSTSEITIKSTNKYSIITLLNYELYQIEQEESTSEITSQLTNEQPATNQQLTTTKKDKKDNKEKNINIPFDSFWNEYDKKVDRPKCKSKWERLTDSEREAIMGHIPNYKREQPDKQYRKNPLTYLNNRSWENEVIKKDYRRPILRGSEYQ